jgi:hypothetical protein
MTGEELEIYAQSIAQEAHSNCGPDHPQGEHKWSDHMFTSRNYAWSLQNTGYTPEQIVHAIVEIAKSLDKFKHPHPREVEEYINGS